MTRLARWWPALLLVSTTALARVGGGQGFGSGGGGGGGGFSGGGGGGGDGGLMLYLLIRLLVEYPAIGIPVLIVGVLILWQMQRSGALEAMVVHGHAHGPHGPGLPPRPARRTRVADAWRALVQDDPGLSEPVVTDRVQLIVRLAHEAVGSGDWAVLGSAVSDEAREQLLSYEDGVQAVREVVLAASPLTEVARAGGYDTLTFDLALSRRETRSGDRVVAAYCEERWTFRRALGTTSRPPDEVRRIACPACGATAPTDARGHCTSCGTAVGHGELSWQAHAVRRVVRRTYTPPDVQRTGGGAEPGYRMPPAFDPDLPAQRRAFFGRHDADARHQIEVRARDVFLRLQEIWSTGRWEDARPLCTDAAWSTLRFWLVQYAEGGLRNRIEDVVVEDMTVVRITMDAWYEAFTVRIAARARDWTERVDNGEVVGGNDRVPKAFAEYWTFLRAVGAEDSRAADARHCPSCGAPLDRVDMSGVCGYCETVITTGRYDWVLSRIEQPEVYGG